MDGSLMASRRRDPAYSQVSVYVPKELAVDFKVACTRAGINQSEAMEEAISLWIQKQSAESQSDE